MDRPDQIGRFKITGKIGHGGMGEVYRGYDAQFQRDVAIKVLRAEQTANAQAIARFDREARLIADLEHPAILPVYEYGRHDRRPFLAMRYMRGGTLRDRLRNGPLPPAEICRLLTPLAEALDLAHRRGVVHRDIKAGNVLLDEEGRPYLADFGIARLTDQTSTLTNAGTPQNMSPEQVAGDAIDRGADIYQLGLLTFELLTGRKAFVADSEDGYKEQHLSAPVPVVATVNPALPAAYDPIFQKALAKRSADRYATAGELVRAFCAVVDKQSQTDGRDNRWLYAAGLLAVAVLAYFAVRALWPDPGAEGDGVVTPAVAETTPPADTPPPPLPSRPPGNARLGERWLRPADGMQMVFVPGGSLMMGGSEAELTALQAECRAATASGQCAPGLFSDTLPAHTVTLSPFWLDAYEVSNGQYQACVEAGVCAAPSPVAPDEVAHFDDPAFADYPVVHVNWSEALTYCTWAGGALPSEAQWEYAARGPDSRGYPWGDQLQDGPANFCDSNCPFGWREAAYNDGSADAAPVGSYTANNSWAGAYDLAGNVWEWTADWYGPYQSSETAQLEPAGPESGAERVIRGGSWAANSWYLWSAARASSPPDTRNPNLGFRCLFSN